MVGSVNLTGPVISWILSPLMTDWRMSTLLGSVSSFCFRLILQTFHSSRSHPKHLSFLSTRDLLDSLSDHDRLEDVDPFGVGVLLFFPSHSTNLSFKSTPDLLDSLSDDNRWEDVDPFGVGVLLFFPSHSTNLSSLSISFQTPFILLDP